MFSIRRNPNGTVSITLSELCNLTRFQSRLLTIFKRHLGKRETALRNFLSDEMGDIISKISWMERQIIKVRLFCHHVLALIYRPYFLPDRSPVSPDYHII